VADEAMWHGEYCAMCIVHTSASAEGTGKFRYLLKGIEATNQKKFSDIDKHL
jgi:hypothetical protein